MLQLLQRNPDAAPRQETVAMHVRAFREKVTAILKSRGNEDDSALPSEEENVAILVEEIKGMLRELPDRLSDRASSLSGKLRSKPRRLDIRTIEEITFGSIFAHFENGPALAFLTVLSMLKDELPWLYEPGMEFYRLLASKARIRVKIAARQMHELVELSFRGPLRELIDDDDKMQFTVRILHDLIERAVTMRPALQDRPSTSRKRQKILDDA
jgi:hypothetical protein